MKRLFDVVFAFVGVVVMSPLMLFCAVWIVVRDGWPFWFLQNRVGKGEKIFAVFKLRTMRAMQGQTSNITIQNDPRVIAGCKWMRDFKVDELPQLFNVLAGSMSMVGPRPTTLDDVARMTADQRRRHSILPGITGLAQVNGDTSISWPMRIRYDLDYVDRKSIALDIEIVLRTVVLLARGSFTVHPIDHNEW